MIRSSREHEGFHFVSLGQKDGPLCEALAACGVCGLQIAGAGWGIAASDGLLELRLVVATFLRAPPSAEAAAAAEAVATAAAVAAAAAAAPVPAAAAAAAPVVAVFANSADVPLEQQDAWLLQESLLQQAGDGWIPILRSGQARKIASSFGKSSPALNVPAHVIRELLPPGKKELNLRAVRLVARPGDEAALAAVTALQAELAGTDTSSFKLRGDKNKSIREYRINMPKKTPLCGALVALRCSGCGLTRMRWGASPHELEIEVAGCST